MYEVNGTYVLHKMLEVFNSDKLYPMVPIACDSVTIILDLVFFHNIISLWL